MGMKTTDSNSLLPAPALVECGPGTQIRLDVSLEPLRIDLRGIDINRQVWEYGFADDGDLVLRFVASRRTPTLEGQAVAIDVEGRPLGDALLLAREGDELVWVCPRPSDETDRWILLSFRAASTSIASRAKKPHPPHPHDDIDSPGNAQPTMIMKPKRNCPTLGKGNPPTIDD